MFTRLTSALITKSRIIIATIACTAGVVSALSGSSLGIENGVSRLRERVMAKSASGRIGVIAIDPRSLREIQAWPWPRSLHGRLAEQLVREGATRVVFDVSFATHSPDPRQDAALAASLARIDGRVSLYAVNDPTQGDKADAMPLPTLLRHATPAAGWVSVDDRNEINLAREMTISHHRVGTLATQLAGVAMGGANYVPDWSIRSDTIPVISAVDVLKGRVPQDAVRGKSFIVGAMAPTFGDQWSDPDAQRVFGVVLHALGAETLISGVATPIGPWLALAVAGLLVIAAGSIRHRPAGMMVLVLAIPALVATTWLARDQMHIAIAVGPAVFAIVSALIVNLASMLAAVVMRRLTTNPATSLPNLAAMQIDAPKGTTVAVRLHNHLDIADALGGDAQARLLRAVRDRIRLAAGESCIYQVDEHSFAWRTTLDDATVTSAIEGLAAVFASGVPIDGKTIDTPVTAGIVDEDDSLAVDAAVTAALLAAEHASRQSLPWTRHVDATAEAEWRLTMMGELDAALGSGDVWVAYQPKWDAKKLRCIGSEALVRWTHPTRGHIRPDQFIPLLEETGRIDKLTAYVLDVAVSDTVRMNDVTIAVNLSTRMLGKGRIVDLVRSTLEKHGMEPGRLTLEITESAALAGEESVRELEELRALGVPLSIDDYGTGQSTLNYLRRMPAAELKIDQSFVRAMSTSRGDRLMIESTIELAHQLNLKVVAEGVETAEEAATLAALDCDVLQGYHLGRPGRIGDLVGIVADRDRREAGTKMKRAS